MARPIDGSEFVRAPRPPNLAESDRTGRWERQPRGTPDPLGTLRAAIVAVRRAPHDNDARGHLRALANEPELRENLALLLADEARAAHAPDVAAALFEELADLHENLDHPLDAITAMEAVVANAPSSADHHDRLAWLYRRAGAWAKAAAAFEQVGIHATDDRGRAALRAAGQLYRDNKQLDRAAETYRAIVSRRPSDDQAWRALDDVMAALGRWHELAELRAQRAALARPGIERAALLRLQARALEHAGEIDRATNVVAEASEQAPDDLSGLVDYADILARSGRAVEAADLLRARIADAIERGTLDASGGSTTNANDLDSATMVARSDEHIAALRLRLVGILDDSGDREGASATLAELLAGSPEYVPALERAAAFAAGDPDPRAHARALLRYSAALPRVDPALIAAAAKRFRDAGDHEAAVRTLEDALDLDPVGLEGALDDARTALLIERATAAAKTGDLTGAERKLHALAVSHPGTLEIHLALAEVMTDAGRLDDAADHLRETLKSLAELPAVQLARLTHRYALLRLVLGDGDEGHRLLHEAHRLDRHDLAITLALGDSCFQRRLWREAARFLGSLADHPEASRHAAAVAAGLLRAAAAEVRSLRPGNALAHVEAAVRVDPSCALAWHALAEAAVERGDLVHAADCLEREATATADPRHRLRLFDALGDMAHDVLADLVRAERCWLQVLEVADAALLHKLLVVQRKSAATATRNTLDRARTCLRLAELEPTSRKPLLEEAVALVAAAGEIERALELAQRLIAAHPLDLDSASCATDVSIAAGDPRMTAIWLRRALAADPASAAELHAPRLAALWKKLGDAERTLGDIQAARRAYRQSTIAAPSSDGAMAARRALVELSTTSQPQTSPYALQSSLFALVELEPEPGDALSLARELREQDPDHARAAYELARAMGAELSLDDERFYEAHPPRPLASDQSYATRLDAATRRELIDDPDDGPLAELFDLLGEVAPRVCPDPRAALLDVDLADAQRLPARNDAAATAILPQISKALEGPATLLYTSARAPREVTLLLAAPPVIVLGARSCSVRAGSAAETDRSDAALRFELGRVVELARWRRAFAVGTGHDFPALLAALAALTPGVDPARVSATAARGAERLRAGLPVTHRKRLADQLAALSPAALDPERYLAACHRAADRAGLLACGDIAVAVELAGGPVVARHLIQLGATRSYLAARRKLRIRDLDDATSPFSRIN